MSELLEKVMEFRKEKYFWKVSEVADFFSISRKRVWELIHSGELKAIKVNGEFRIHRDWVVEYIEKNIV